MNNLPAAQTPFDTLTEALGGLYIGHCLTSVTNFKVADALGDTPRTAAELAADTGANPEALRRMLRLLAAHGVFSCSEDRFAHTPASQLLRADHPYSMRDFVAMTGTSTAAEQLGYSDYTLQTGNPTPYKVNLDGFFALCQAEPEFGQLFNMAMSSRHACRSPPSRPPTTSRSARRSPTSAAAWDTCCRQYWTRRHAGAPSANTSSC